MADRFRPLAVTEATRPRRWVSRSACRGVDPETFFPEVKGRIFATDPRVTKARQICRGCLVKWPCLFDAIRNGEDGIWGGTIPTEREQLRRWEAQGAS